MKVQYFPCCVLFVYDRVSKLHHKGLMAQIDPSKYLGMNSIVVMTLEHDIPEDGGN